MIKTGETKYFPEYRIYKPRSGGDGSATRLQLKEKMEKFGPRVFLFLESVKQIGFDEKKNAKFDWKDPKGKITMKLESVDIGELLAVLTGLKHFIGTDPSKGLYHQHPNGNTVLTFNKILKDNQTPYFALRISAKRKMEKEALVIQHTITLGEAAILRSLLNEAILRMYRWK
jgi:hypothetical protein